MKVVAKGITVKRRKMRIKSKDSQRESRRVKENGEKMRGKVEIDDGERNDGCNIYPISAL